MKTMWKILSIVVALMLVFVAPFGWWMADDRLILQILVVVVYIWLAWFVNKIIIEAWK